jgi:hypothetical protein
MADGGYPMRVPSRPNPTTTDSNSPSSNTALDKKADFENLVFMKSIVDRLKKDGWIRDDSDVWLT